jgi:hypothetical protein
MWKYPRCIMKRGWSKSPSLNFVRSFSKNPEGEGDGGDFIGD